MKVSFNAKYTRKTAISRKVCFTNNKSVSVNTQNTKKPFKMILVAWFAMIASMLPASMQQIKGSQGKNNEVIAF